MKEQSRKCRFCGSTLNKTFVDLGLSPLSNSYLTAEDVQKGQMTYPLHTYVCTNCFLVQLEEFESPSAIFSDYAYFSSFSESWLLHAKRYTEAMMNRFGLNTRSLVVEIASNDGYLLQYFKKQNVPVLGIEPALNVAKAAAEKGIRTITEFFGADLAKRLCKDGRKADLLLGNNVLAHVPVLNDFVEGLKLLLKPEGVITMEFPHLLNLIRQKQFDTIYHEHFSYLSLYTTKKIFETHGMKIFDVQEWPTHGGSLRIFACHQACSKYPVKDAVETLLDKERKAGVADLKLYEDFSEQVRSLKRDLLHLLVRLKWTGAQIAAYGAPAKGNTLLNYCGIGTEFISYTVDRSPYKQEKFLPGTLIPVFSPEKLAQTRPEYILILPWNLKEEIISQLTYTKEWGAKFILPVPEVEVI